MRIAEAARVADDFDVLSRERMLHDLRIQLPNVKESNQAWDSVVLFW